jgi:hypothetical protein
MKKEKTKLKELTRLFIKPGLTASESPGRCANNIGKVPYEEVIIFFIDKPDMEPQPEA